MRTPSMARPSRREPDNELYDRGCCLVAAAAAISRASAAPGAARALPAALGCIEAAFGELLAAAAAREQTAAAATSAAQRLGARTRAAALEARMHRGYAKLQRALAARALTARAFERAGSRRRPAVGAAREVIHSRLEEVNES